MVFCRWEMCQNLNKNVQESVEWLYSNARNVLKLQTICNINLILGEAGRLTSVFFSAILRKYSDLIDTDRMLKCLKGVLY